MEFDDLMGCKYGVPWNLKCYNGNINVDLLLSEWAESNEYIQFAETFQETIEKVCTEFIGTPLTERMFETINYRLRSEFQKLLSVRAVYTDFLSKKYRFCVEAYAVLKEQGDYKFDPDAYLKSRTIKTILY